MPQIEINPHLNTIFAKPFKWRFSFSDYGHVHVFHVVSQIWMMLHTIVPIAMYLLENTEVGVVKPIIELTTCFHEFYEHESTNLFHQYFSVEQQNKFLIGQKKNSQSWIFEKIKTNTYHVIFGGKIRRLVFRKFVKIFREPNIYIRSVTMKPKLIGIWWYQTFLLT